MSSSSSTKSSTIYIRKILTLGTLFSNLKISFSQQEEKSFHNNKRVAIIGGGLGGSFAAKYLADYNSEKCNLDSIVLFDPLPLGNAKDEENHYNNDTNGKKLKKENLQGSRVAHVTLADGTVIEVGASIAYTGNRLVKEITESDPNLQIVPPFFNKEKYTTSKKKLAEGFGIWNGTHLHSSNSNFIFNTNAAPSWLTTMRLLYRYNIDLFRLSSTVDKILQKFNRIYDHLDSNHPSSFFHSSTDMWDAVELSHLIQISFQQLLNDINVSLPNKLQWWRRWFLPYQGNLREELLEAVNLCNYNQDNDNLNGLVGLISFVPTKGELFSIAGGNSQLISSAFQQAKQIFDIKCSSKIKRDGKNNNVIQHIPKQITTVISDSDAESFELWSSDEMVGQFDVVILAAPLQQSQISFYIQSHFDSVVLQDMPLNGMTNADIEDANEHNHRPPSLPSSATLTYTQVVTTVISNATIRHSRFGVTDPSIFPRSVYNTKEGKKAQQFQSLTQITADGVYKLFSMSPFHTHTLDTLFHPGYIVEYVKTWGGAYGGATPNFGGGGEASTSIPYLLYDGGLNLKGRDGGKPGPGLYYINSIEAAAASMEISAIGAKSVAKLVAQRLGMLNPYKDDFATEL